MIHIAALIGLGILAVMTSGLIGIGGGIAVVPVLVLFFRFSQQLAQGTTLALMVPPLGAFAAWTYYRQSNDEGITVIRSVLQVYSGDLIISGLRNGLTAAGHTVITVWKLQDKAESGIEISRIATET